MSLLSASKLKLPLLIYTLSLSEESCHHLLLPYAAPSLSCPAPNLGLAMTLSHVNMDWLKSSCIPRQPSSCQTKKVFWIKANLGKAVKLLPN